LIFSAASSQVSLWLAVFTACTVAYALHLTLTVRRLNRLLADMREAGTDSERPRPPTEAPARLSLSLTLPPASDAAAALKKAPPVHVLIVDDHEINRRIVSLFIEPLGWGWTMAETGAEAVDLCRKRPFDVILMDMLMPVMDGLAATRAIRAGHGPNQATPIVALSASALDHHRKAWTEVGVEDFLAKPIDPEQLITMLAYKASGHTADINEVA